MSGEATSDEAELDDASAALAAVQQRVNVLENLALRTITIAVAALLAAGALVPFATDSNGSASIVTAVKTISDSDDVGENQVLIMIGFVGLTLCTVVAIGLLFAMWRRTLGHAAVTMGSILVVALAIGALVTLVFTLRAEGLSDGEAGYGLALFVPGIVGLAFTLVAPVRDLWYDRTDRSD